MLERFARRVYLHFGRRYKLVLLVMQEPAALAIATVAILLMTSYYHPSVGDTFVMVGGAWVSTLFAVGYSLYQAMPYLERVTEWQELTDPTAAESAAAWDAATNFPMRSFRANAIVVGVIAALPSVTVIVLTLGLGIGDGAVLLAASLLPVAYGTILNYFIAELLIRPVIEDIAAVLPEDFPFASNGLLIRKRLKILLPVFTGFVGLTVAALVTGHGGTRMLGLSVLAAGGVGLILSFELTVLLSRSVTGPIAGLRLGLARVREGDYTARVPVVTSDELGELSHTFNLMASGMEERERMRDAFGTYLDRDIVRLLLDGSVPEGGVEVVVSIMFVDVRGFTSFAESAAPSGVVATLNALFETIVPIIVAHGGHVDKFMGDGLMAVFGAPEGFPDHADRAVSAGRELLEAVGRSDVELRVGVGINTGAVIAGSIGGAGRLNFSVIGDPVNVSARVEAATRDLGDDLLLTSQTREALIRPLECESRGTIALKGKAMPVELFACRDLSSPGDELGGAIRAEA